MKALKTLICAFSLTAAFINSKADLTMTASGTVEIQKSFAFASNIATTATMTINNKYIYTVISNAVANAAFWSGTNISASTLPADGYIVFNPDSDGTVSGTFYVVDKSGFSYQLSGRDGNGQYYSWIELDSENSFYEFFNEGFQFGWGNTNGSEGPFNGVASYHLSSKGVGTQTQTSTALLYVHDDPYCYDDANNPNIFWENSAGQGGSDDMQTFNDNALEVRGIVTVTMHTTNIVSNISNLSLSGSGNLLYDPYPGYSYVAGNVVKSATVKFGK